MKTVKYKFSQEFTQFGLSRWLTSYAVLEPDDDPEECAKQLMTQSSKIIQESVKKQAEETPVIQQEKKTTGFAHFEEKINACTTIEKPDGIEQWRTIADTNPKLKEVFNNRLNELKNGLE